ncbi:MAG: hypothetical protein WAV56_01055 [Microgenomates group bacterium]
MSRAVFQKVGESNLNFNALTRRKLKKTKKNITPTAALSIRFIIPVCPSDHNHLALVKFPHY